MATAFVPVREQHHSTVRFLAVQRTVDEEGNLVEMVIDEEGNLIDELPAGSVADLPVMAESRNQWRQTTRTVRDVSGSLITLIIGPDGSIIDTRPGPPP